MRRDWIAGVILLGVSFAYYRIALNIPRSQLSDVVGAASFPKLLAVILAILSSFLVISGLKAEFMPGKAKEVKITDDAKAFLRAGGTVLIGIGYLLVIQWTGYAVAATLLIVAMLVYNHEKISWKAVGISAGAGVFLWFLFAVLFDIPVPQGVWIKLFQG